MDRLEELMTEGPIDAADVRKTVLCVDDEPSNLQVLKRILQAEYRLLFARDGRRAIELARAEQPDLVLLDVMMPDMDGHAVCRTFKADERLARVPVIFVTALSDVEDEARGLELGAVDYICKPVSPAIVRARVRTHLSLVSVSELIETRLQVIQRLGLAAEYKDNETGLHVIRMSHYACILARAAGWSEQRAQELLHAAPMHDIGKIGIPDHILRKPGKFDDHEWEIMKSHVEIGVRIIGEHDSGLLAVARRIVSGHHEKWDGSGYPHGLRETAIPIEARIVAIADVFDALTSERPYKKAWSVEDACALLVEQKGRHFEPRLVDLFLDCLPQVLEIKQRWAERAPDAP
ncbi:HD-GYP domain-containing protein [Methyloversatilis discipulorum]|uniref:HD-GYP domain-containing protein n=1 Tax=Methyloversatilis discipulorum TaxID=1119528 RepID=UPI001A5F2A0F|nr:HD domain-containing phosphohydrolase [Methyloversatilis discipulorum]MBL8466401.1 response regulator [Methyloversatilis discipulorum]